MEATEVGGHWERRGEREGVVQIHDGVSATNKDGILALATTSMDLQGIKLNEVSPRKMNSVRFSLYVEFKNKQANEWINQTETNL